jgi:hypothetical protein
MESLLSKSIGPQRLSVSVCFFTIPKKRTYLAVVGYENKIHVASTGLWSHPWSKSPEAFLSLWRAIQVDGQVLLNCKSLFIPEFILNSSVKFLETWRRWYQLIKFHPVKHGRSRTKASSQRSTVAARVQSQVRSCGIRGGQSDTGAGFLRVLRFPLPVPIPPNSPYSSSVAGTVGKLVADIPTGLSLTPIPQN